MNHSAYGTTLLQSAPVVTGMNQFIKCIEAYYPRLTSQWNGGRGVTHDWELQNVVRQKFSNMVKHMITSTTCQNRDQSSEFKSEKKPFHAMVEMKGHQAARQLQKSIESVEMALVVSISLWHKLGMTGVSGTGWAYF